MHLYQQHLQKISRAFDKWKPFQKGCLSLKLAVLLLFLFMVDAEPLNAMGASIYNISSDKANLTILEIDENQFGVEIQLNNDPAIYDQYNPIAVEVYTNDQVNTWYESSYSSIEDMGDDTFKCTGTITSANGSVFSFTDIYSVYDATGTFEINRSVEVLNVNENDLGFSTRLAFQRSSVGNMNDYDFFVPSIWYKDNADVSNNALATDYNDYYYWFREDRMPLPLFMLHEKDNGVTFSVFHKDPDGSTFKGEDGLNMVIDGRMKFASMGMQNNSQPLVGMLFPGSEGERTGIYGMSTEKRWAKRSNPVTLGYEQHYKMALRLTEEPDYVTALQNTWATYYKISDPALYEVDLEKVYKGQIEVLDQYWRSIKDAAGLPFQVKLNGVLANESDYNYRMGFVGMQIPNAWLMIREGLKTQDAELLSKGEQIADFWAFNSISLTGAPKMWYDPYIERWRDPEVFIRDIGDGMIGLLRAWSVEKQYGHDKSQWLDACVRVADWLIDVQGADGSYYRTYNYNTGEEIQRSKNCTSQIIPFLSEVYFVTQDERYRDAALKAGAYIYTDIMDNFRYIGGAVDNPNIPDKEAASMALRAFWALHDLENDQQWLEGVMQTVYYYQTWVFSWDVPIPADDNNAIFPKTRSMTGQSQIATGNHASDTYAAIDAFGFYRAYLHSGDEHLLRFSEFLLKNTKQFINWDMEDPIPGFAPNFMGEAMNVTIPRGHGVEVYLPWSTYNQLEPIVLLEDVFGFKDISAIQSLPIEEQNILMQQYATNHGLERGEAIEGVTPIIGEGNGLRGEYFKGNKDLDKNGAHPDFTRTDAIIDFDWGEDSPWGTKAELGDIFWSIRWKGEVLAPYSGVYTFYQTWWDDGSRLFIDGKTIIDDFVDEWDKPNRKGEITLEAGKRYPIEIHYRENFGSAHAQLEWACKEAGMARGVVPQSQLYAIESPVTGIREGSATNEVKIYPNPATSSFVINWEGLDNGFAIVDFSIVRMDGKLIYQEKVEGKKSCLVRADQWDKGVYIVVLKSTKTVINKKIVVQ